MQIFDSYIEASEGMTKEDRAEYLTAIIDYLYYGTEPNIEGVGRFVVKAMMPSLEKSRKQALNGRRGGRPRSFGSGVQDGAENRDGRFQETKTGDNGKPESGETENPNSGSAESETEENGKAKGNSKGSKKVIAKAITKEADSLSQAEAEADADPFSAFLAECLEAYNEETGQTLGWIPPSAALNLRRAFDGGVTSEQVRLMVRAKRSEWGGDAKMARYVRASTLFGDKMADYLAASSRGGAGVEDPYDVYA